MEKTIRSYLNSLIIILIFYYATRGIVKLFWNHSNEEVIKARTFILFVCLFFGSFFYIVITYHLVDGKTIMVHFFYKIYLFVAFLYIVVGLISDIISSSNLSSKKNVINNNNRYKGKINLLK
jgi:hypothetical protein